MKTRLLACASLIAGLALASGAHADPRTHDGFYLQGATGIGYLNTSSEFGGFEQSISGVTIPSSIAIGGSVIPGLAIAGALGLDYAFSPGAEVNGQEVPTAADVSLMLISIGAQVDFYPDPAEGLHFQGLIGYGALESSVNGDVSGSDPTGFVLGLGAGYDFWVADELSLGVLGRFNYAPLSYEDISYSTISPALLATITYQ